MMRLICGPVLLIGIIFFSGTALSFDHDSIKSFGISPQISPQSILVSEPLLIKNIIVFMSFNAEKRISSLNAITLDGKQVRQFDFQEGVLASNISRYDNHLAFLIYKAASRYIELILINFETNVSEYQKLDEIKFLLNGNQKLAILSYIDANRILIVTNNGNWLEYKANENKKEKKITDKEINRKIIIYNNQPLIDNNGSIYLLTYDQLISVAIEPIERSSNNVGVAPRGPGNDYQPISGDQPSTGSKNTSQPKGNN